MRAEGGAELADERAHVRELARRLRAAVRIVAALGPWHARAAERAYGYAPGGAGFNAAEADFDARRALN